jgi:alpha-L-fucosidase 2
MIAFSALTAGLAGASGNIAIHRDIEFSRPDGVRLALDAAVPESSGRCPAVIVVHGGGWVRGDRVMDVQPLFQPLSEAGFAWFSISYRLMNDITQFGKAVADVEAAVRYVKEHADEYHVDADRIALVGESAGGQLAAMAALGNSPDLGVRAVVAIYAPTDLEALARNSDYVPQWIRQGVRGTPWEQLILARLRQLSPIEHVRPGMPPFLFIHGTADRLVPFEQSRAMCERMEAAGAKCELFPVQGGGHGLRWWEQNVSLARPYKQEMVRWLKTHLS